jgi:hypothetical protein
LPYAFEDREEVGGQNSFQQKNQLASKKIPKLIFLRQTEELVNDLLLRIAKKSSFRSL